MCLEPGEAREGSTERLAADPQRLRGDSGFGPVMDLALLLKAV